MNYDPPPEFGQFIKNLRESRHLSHGDVEDITGVSESTLDRWERGKVGKIRYSTLKPFAEKLFNQTVDDFITDFERYRNDATASGAVQPTTNSPTTDEMVNSMSSDTMNDATSFHRKWRLNSKVVFSFVIAALLVFALCIFMLNTVLMHSTVKPILISGNVSCTNNESVVGIWVDVFKDGKIDKNISGYADLRTFNSNGSEVIFVKVLEGDAYNLHVGCGGSGHHWKGIYTTELGTGPVHDHSTHSFICYPEAIDYGACKLIS